MQNLSTDLSSTYSFSQSDTTLGFAVPNTTVPATSTPTDLAETADAAGLVDASVGWSNSGLITHTLCLSMKHSYVFSILR